MYGVGRVSPGLPVDDFEAVCDADYVCNLASNGVAINASHVKVKTKSIVL